MIAVLMNVVGGSPAKCYDSADGTIVSTNGLNEVYQYGICTVLFPSIFFFLLIL